MCNNLLYLNAGLVGFIGWLFDLIILLFDFSFKCRYRVLVEVAFTLHFYGILASLSSVFASLLRVGRF